MRIAFLIDSSYNVFWLYDKLLEARYGDWRVPAREAANHKTIVISVGDAQSVPEKKLERER